MTAVNIRFICFYKLALNLTSLSPSSRRIAKEKKKTGLQVWLDFVTKLYEHSLIDHLLGSCARFSFVCRVKYTVLFRSNGLSWHLPERV